MQGVYSSDADEDYSEDNYSAAGSDEASRESRGATTAAGRYDQQQQDGVHRIREGERGGGGGASVALHLSRLPPYGLDGSLLYTEENSSAVMMANHSSNHVDDDGDSDDDGEMFEDGTDVDGAGGNGGNGGGGDGGGGFADIPDEDYEPTDHEVQEYCEWLTLDPVAEKSLIWIAREALKAPLPENWKMCYTDDREIYYFNMRTGESIWDHPMDAFYKSLFREEKAKLDKKRKSMRLFTGATAVESLPMAEFFSEVSETCGSGYDAFNGALAGAFGVGGSGVSGQPPPPAWWTVPETLVDPIDMRIFVDPIVLPTSGRTVSRHTIINNKWRDPFSREYIENRRLVPNVDKRGEVDRYLQRMIEKYFETINNNGNSSSPAGSDLVGQGFRRLLILMPYMIDKDQEVCVWAQKFMQGWFEKQLQQARKSEAQKRQAQMAASASTPTVSPNVTPRSNGGDDSAVSLASSSACGSASFKKLQTAGGQGSRKDSLGGTTSDRKQSTVNKKLQTSIAHGRTSSNCSSTSSFQTMGKPNGEKSAGNQSASSGATPPPHLLDVIASSTPAERDQMLRCLLSMSSSASRETLLALVSAMPALLREEAFGNFSEEVLYVLRVSQRDLWDVANFIHTKEGVEASKLEAAGEAAVPSTTTPQTTSSGSPWCGLGAASSGPSNGSGNGFEDSGGPNLHAATAATPATDAWASRSVTDLFACHTVTDSERLLSLRWAAILAMLASSASSLAEGSNDKLNAQHRHPVGSMDFLGAIHIVLAMHASLQKDPKITEFAVNIGCSNISEKKLNTEKSTIDSSAASGIFTTALTELLSVCDGWPIKLSGCTDKHLRCLLELAVLDPNPKQQISTLFELCLQGSERCLDVIRRSAPQIKQSLIDLANQQQQQQQQLCAGGGQEGLSLSSGVTFTNVDLMAAVMVFHEMAALQDFAQHCPPLVALKIGYNLTPRLTRSQWRPRHFHSTVTALQQLVDEHPAEAWIVMDRVGLSFFLKELTKKRSHASEIRAKLESLEHSEKMLEASAALNRWALLSVRVLMKRKQAIGELIKERKRHLVATGRRLATPPSSQQQCVPPPPPLSVIPKLPSIRGAQNLAAAPPGQTQELQTQTFAVAQAAEALIPGQTPIGSTVEWATPQQLGRVMARGTEITRQRSELLSQTLQLLISVRLKPKQRPPPPTETSSSQLRKKQPTGGTTPRAESNSGSHAVSVGHAPPPPPPPPPPVAERAAARPRSGRGSQHAPASFASVGDSAVTLPRII